MDQHHHHHSQQQGQGQMGHGSLIGCQGQPLQPPPPPSPLTSMTIESKLMNNNGTGFSDYGEKMIYAKQFFSSFSLFFHSLKSSSPYR